MPRYSYEGVPLKRQQGDAIAEASEQKPTDFFELPHDVLTRLGDGNPDMGTVVAYDMFAHPGYTMANPYILPAEIVRDIGHGSLEAGHQVLRRFVDQVRAKHRDRNGDGDLKQT